MASAKVEQATFRVVGMVSGLIAVTVTRKILTTVWKQVEGDEPPTNPGTKGTNWTEALTWAVASGAALAVSSVVARRGAAEAWKAATGSYPEGSDQAIA